MRRIALLGPSMLPPSLLLAALLLAGCQTVRPYAGSPAEGFTDFVGDTHTWNGLPTTPPAQSENERRARGEDMAVAPLLPEPGDVWPGPPTPIPTMQELQNLNNNVSLPPPTIPTGPMSPVFPQNAPLPQNAPSPPGRAPAP